jgi:hypothetical protein
VRRNFGQLFRSTEAERYELGSHAGPLLGIQGRFWVR